MNDSISKISWEEYKQKFDPKKTQWTLLHGDFHPANQMIDPQAPSDSNITTLDWEGIGLGVGPSELAWYLISHVEPSLRRECEAQLLDEYY